MNGEGTGAPRFCFLIEMVHNREKDREDSMARKPLPWLMIIVVLCCGAWNAGAAQVRRDPTLSARPPATPRKDPGRDVMLQTIGMLAGQGLVFGHESLEGIFVRYENRLLAKEKAEAFLADFGRYAALVVSVFKKRLMGQLADQERKDLALLIGFYEAQAEAVSSLEAYVRNGGVANREAFRKNQERVAAIIHQISLGNTSS